MSEVLLGLLPFDVQGSALPFEEQLGLRYAREGEESGSVSLVHQKQLGGGLFNFRFGGETRVR